MQDDGSGSPERERHAGGAGHAWGQADMARWTAGAPALADPAVTVQRLHQIKNAKLDRIKATGSSRGGLTGLVRTRDAEIDHIGATGLRRVGTAGRCRAGTAGGGTTFPATCGDPAGASRHPARRCGTHINPPLPPERKEGRLPLMEATLFGSAAGPDSRGPVALRPRIAPGLPFREVVSQSICIPNSTQEADIATSNVRRNIRADDPPHPVGRRIRIGRMEHGGTRERF